MRIADIPKPGTTVTHKTLRALGHAVRVRADGCCEVQACPERAGTYGEITAGDWTEVATAVADSGLDSYGLRTGAHGEDWAAADEALAIRKARTA